MRVSPWNQYHVVEQEDNPEPQVAFRKDELTNVSASFVFYSDASAEETRTPRVGSVHHSDASSDSSTSNSSGEHFPDNVVDEIEERTGARSSMEESLTGYSSFSVQAVGPDVSLRELPINSPGFAKSRVKWTDAYGKSLVEIKEFEISDDEGLSDEDPRYSSEKCRCAIQ